MKETAPKLTPEETKPYLVPDDKKSCDKIDHLKRSIANGLNHLKSKRVKEILKSEEVIIE